MAGLFGDSFDDPRTQATLQLAAGLLGARGPQGWAQGLLGYQGALQSAKDSEAKRKALELDQQMRQAQLAQLQAQQRRQEQMQALPQQFMRNPAQTALAAGGGPTQANAQAMEQANPSFDFAGYAQALAAIDPVASLQMQASLQKEDTPVKLGPDETLYSGKASGYKLLAKGQPKAEAQPSAVREYEFARSQGYPGSFQQFQLEQRRAGAASTTVSLGSPVPITMPDGSQALVQPANRPGEPAQIVRIPGTGEIARPPAKEMPAAVAEKFASNAVTLGKIDKALSLVERRPQSLGLQNYLPDPLIQRVDPSGVEVRALVADIGGQKIHDRSGAAVTVGETARLKPYIPSATDTPQVASQKLRLFRQEYAAMQQALASGASIKQAAQQTPAGAGIFQDADKERRYQEWKARQQ